MIPEAVGGILLLITLFVGGPYAYRVVVHASRAWDLEFAASEERRRLERSADLEKLQRSQELEDIQHRKQKNLLLQAALQQEHYVFELEANIAMAILASNSRTLCF